MKNDDFRKRFLKNSRIAPQYTITQDLNVLCYIISRLPRSAKVEQDKNPTLRWTHIWVVFEACISFGNIVLAISNPRPERMLELSFRTQMPTYRARVTLPNSQINPIFHANDDSYKMLIKTTKMPSIITSPNLWIYGLELTLNTVTVN